MKTKKIICLVCVMFLAGFILIGSNVASAAEITVDAGGVGDYTTIADAVAAATAGDTIIIKSGTYEVEDSGKIVVDKSLTIQGESKDDTYIKQVGYDNLFEITADGVTIKNLKLEAGYSTIISVRANDVTIENINFVAEGYSIAIDCSDDDKTGLTVKNVNATGKSCTFKKLSSSTWESSTFGGSGFNTITDSTVTDCTFIGGGITLNEETSNLKFLGCTFKDHDNTCFQMTGTNNKIYNCNFENLGINEYGNFNAINLQGTNNEIKGNTFTGCGWGISVFNKDNTIAYNNFVDNVGGGVIATENNMGEGNKINVDNNWWGDVSGPTNADLNPTGTGDKASQNVEFTTWLDAESTWQPDDDTSSGDTNDDKGGDTSDDSGDTSGNTNENTSKDDSSNTPGFELILVLSALFIGLIFLRKKKMKLY